MLLIRDLVKVYPGPVAALQGVDLDVGSGMFGLLGPNGAGKTTLMKVVAGLLEPTSGSVELEGQDIVHNPEVAWSQLGYLPQDFGFYPHLSAHAMLVYLLRLKGVTADVPLNELADQLLARVGLTGDARREVGGYSGGMRQRLGIAQALAGDPKLIIVDEPTSGLDPEERLRFYRLLAEMAEGRTVILSTHIVEDIAVLCPRFAVMRDGEIVADTTPSDARDSIRGTIYERTIANEDLAQVAAQNRVTQALLVEGRYRVRVHADNGNVPEGFEQVAPTLEDAYLVLMGAK